MRGPVHTFFSVWWCPAGVCVMCVHNANAHMQNIVYYMFYVCVDRLRHPDGLWTRHMPQKAAKGKRDNKTDNRVKSSLGWLDDMIQSYNDHYLAIGVSVHKWPNLHISTSSFIALIRQLICTHWFSLSLLFCCCCFISFFCPAVYECRHEHTIYNFHFACWWWDRRVKQNRQKEKLKFSKH